MTSEELMDRAAEVFRTELSEAEIDLGPAPGRMAWVSPGHDRNAGYWAGIGSVKPGYGTPDQPDGSGFVLVNWVDGRVDDNAASRCALALHGIPADAIGDGTALALLAVNAIRADWARHAKTGA